MAICHKTSMAIIFGPCSLVPINKYDIIYIFEYIVVHLTPKACVRDTKHACVTPKAYVVAVSLGQKGSQGRQSCSERILESTNVFFWFCMTHPPTHPSSPSHSPLLPSSPSPSLVTGIRIICALYHNLVTSILI